MPMMDYQDNAGFSGLGVGFTDNAQIDSIEDERRDIERQAQEDQNRPVVQALAEYVRTCWEAARQARDTDVQERLLQCLRQRSGVYDPDIAQAIEDKGGSDVFMMLTDEKCTAAESWLEDILLPPDDKPWGIEPTPVPDPPPQVLQQIQSRVQYQAQVFIQTQGVQPSPEGIAAITEDMIEQEKAEVSKQARKEAERVQDELDDILQEADWRTAIKEFLYYFVTYPVAFMKGPVLRSKSELRWDEYAQPTVEQVIVKQFDVPSPFDIYPSPSSRGIDDGFLIERHTLTRSDLYALIGTGTGYSDEAIREVLRSYDGEARQRSWLWVEDSTRDDLEGRVFKDNDPEGRIDALQFWGSVSGSKLLEWSGWDDGESDSLDPERDYPAEVWLIDSVIIKAVLNPDPLGRKPYFKASFRELYGQFYGLGLPEIIRDVHTICNSAARNLVDNMAIASGPQVGVDAAAMPEGEDYTQLFPWRVWPFDLSGTANSVNHTPIWFFQPPSMAQELMAVYQTFSEEADNKSGIPRYAYGHKETGGPLATATGFSMMMNNAARGIKKVVRNIDYGVISPSIMRLYDWLMLYDDEFRATHKGDIKIIARGSSALVAKEQSQIRLVEVLQLVLQSPELIQLAGLSGLADIFRKVLRGVDVGVDDVVPTDTEINALQAAMQAQQQQQMQIQQQMQMQQQANSSAGPRGGRQTNQAGEPVSGQDARAF